MMKKIRIYDEKIIDLSDKILQKVYFAHETHKMSLFSDLFGVWTGGCGKIWSPEGRIAGILSNLQV